MSLPPPDDDPSQPVEDGMHPPTVPQLVHCIHCGEEYDSWRIEWRVFPAEDGGQHGFWCCPMPGCDGAGFGMDIYPVDFPEDGCWRDPDGRELHVTYFDDENEEWDESEDEDFDVSEFPPLTPPPDDLPSELDTGYFGEDDIPF